MNFFSMDNFFFRTVGKLTDLVWVNLLTLICALPVFTAGASLTAMYSILLKMVKNEEGHITAGFFKSFKENFKNATKVWLCALLVFIVCAANLQLLKNGVMAQMPTRAKVSAISIGIILIALAIFLQYLFPMLSRYDQTLKQTMKNAVLLAGAFLPRTICMLIIGLFPLALMMLSNYFFWLWFLYGFSFTGYLCSMLLVRVFEKAEEMTGR